MNPAWYIAIFSGISLLITILVYTIQISRKAVTSDQIEKLATKELLKSTRELLETKIGNAEKIVSIKIDTINSDISGLKKYTGYNQPASTAFELAKKESANRQEIDNARLDDK